VTARGVVSVQIHVRPAASARPVLYTPYAVGFRRAVFAVKDTTTISEASLSGLAPHQLQAVPPGILRGLAMARDFRAVSPPLLPGTLAALERQGFRSMTPVQAATLPLFLGNKDVAVEVCFVVCR
jgi:hypothetical protein